jgi:hypothetical protein
MLRLLPNIYFYRHAGEYVVEIEELTKDKDKARYSFKAKSEKRAIMFLGEYLTTQNIQLAREIKNKKTLSPEKYLQTLISILGKQIKFLKQQKTIEREILPTKVIKFADLAQITNIY